ncbi:MAG: hypothetical protein Q7T33_15050 [Dehalococcoidia bacterium]|nr:hypothetical protein [Dehalococcoidia bacterium]
MNSGELRRFLFVVLPAGLCITVVAVLVATVLQTHVATAPGPGGGTGAPRTADHWHATYQFLVCGVRQPNFPTWEGVGVHTHADGVIHIHPFSPAEEGRGARLVKFFEYGGGKLTGDEVRAPGTRKTYGNGEICPDGRAGVVQVIVSGESLADWSEYIPADGDRIIIIFGPPQQQVSAAGACLPASRPCRAALDSGRAFRILRAPSQGGAALAGNRREKCP